MEPLHHLFSEAIQHKISSFLSYPCSSHWSHCSSSIYKSTLYPNAKHLIIFFNSVNITLLDATPHIRANKRHIPTTNDIIEINNFDSMIFMNCYINSQCILDQIILSPLNQSFTFKNRLRFCSLLRTLYRCKNAETLYLWFDHCQPQSYDLMPIWSKYLKIIANDIIFCTNSKIKLTQFHLARLRTLKLKFNHSWICNDISLIIDALNNDTEIRWKLIKNLEITSMCFHSLSLLQCPLMKMFDFWRKAANIFMISCYLEPKGNEWNDHLMNELLTKYKKMPKSLKILQCFTTFHRVPKLEMLSKRINVCLIPYMPMVKVLGLDIYRNLLYSELHSNEVHKNGNKKRMLSSQQIIKSYLGCSDNLSMTLMKIIAFKNGTNAQIIQHILSYIIKFCQSILCENGVVSYSYQQSVILRLCCLMIYFLKTFWIETVGQNYEWIANIAHKLHDIGEKFVSMSFKANIAKIIRRTSISMDKFCKYCIQSTIFRQEKYQNGDGSKKRAFVPISLPLVSYIKTMECTPTLYANCLLYLYATLLSQILYSPTYHTQSSLMLSLFKMINYDQLSALCDQSRTSPKVLNDKNHIIDNHAWYAKDFRYLTYQILLLCLNKNRNLWAAQKLCDILASTQNATRSMGYPPFIKRNEYDDELEGIQQQIEDASKRILRHNVLIPLGDVSADYFKRLLCVEKDKRLMEFNGVWKCKLVTKHYIINEAGCHFFSYH